MKKKELFDKTVAILMKAYFENTLEHTNCYACAVQNLVVANMGMSIVPKPKSHPLVDCDTVNFVIKGISYEKTLVSSLGEISLKEAALTKFQIKQMISTGYNYDELTEIERAFEGVHKRDYTTEDAYMYAGLMAVIDYLMVLHKATTEEITAAKQLFVKL